MLKIKKNQMLATGAFVAFLCSFVSGCGTEESNNKEIVLWTSSEDYVNEYHLTSLREKFPEYDFTLEYMNSSTIAAKILAEGDNSACDIILSEEYNYLEMCKEYLAELNFVDVDQFLPELILENPRYTPQCRNGGCVAVNLEVLEKKGVGKPTCYADLLESCYKNLISMPSPASSGTGYMFLRQLTNEWGEDEAFSYFEKLSENVLQYTSSGSGAINALVQGEVAIALGMTTQVVEEMNKGANLEIIYFEEGSPYGMYGSALMKSSADREGVQEIFNYVATELCMGTHQKYLPEQIFKDYQPEISGFPTHITYGNMSNDTLEEKERLIEKWTFS